MFPWNLFPFNKEMKDRMQKMKPEDVDQFIHGIFGKAIPSQVSGMMNPENFMNQFKHHNTQQEDKLSSVVFETHDSVFVRFPIKDENKVQQIRIFHTANQLIVEHFPEIDDKHPITLPAIVKRKGTSAKYKDGILEVRLIKSYDIKYSEIDVSEI